MGIQIEFNPDLCLRKYNTSNRHFTECLPEKLIEKKHYHFQKSGHRCYWLQGQIPLRETDGSILSRPLAAITIIETRHILLGNKPATIGRYRIDKILNTKEQTIHFEGYEWITKEKQ